MWNQNLPNMSDIMWYMNTVSSEQNLKWSRKLSQLKKKKLRWKVWFKIRHAHSNASFMLDNKLLKISSLLKRKKNLKISLQMYMWINRFYCYSAGPHIYCERASRNSEMQKCRNAHTNVFKLLHHNQVNKINLKLEIVIHMCIFNCELNRVCVVNQLY